MLPRTPIVSSHERLVARAGLDGLAARLATIPHYIHRGDSIVIGEDAARLVARALVLLHPGEVAGLLNTYEAVLEPALVDHAHRSMLATSLVALDVLAAAELVGLFRLASPRLARQSSGTAERMLELVAASSHCVAPPVLARLHTLSLAFSMEEATSIVIAIATDAVANSPDGRIHDRLESAIATASASPDDIEELVATLPFFVDDHGVRWNDLVWATQAMGRRGGFGDQEVFGVVRHAIGVGVADSVRASARVGVQIDPEEEDAKVSPMRRG